MYMRRKAHSTSLVLLLICIFAFWWGISVFSQHTFTVFSSVTTNAQQTSAVIVHETVSGNTRTYSGTFNSKAMCGSFGSGIQYSAQNGGSVSVLLVTDASAQCAQSFDASAIPEPFNVSIQLPGTTPTFEGVLLNGIALPSQLVQ